jgi:hypothetical protein
MKPRLFTGNFWMVQLAPAARLVPQLALAAEVCFLRISLQIWSFSAASSVVPQMAENKGGLYSSRKNSHRFNFEGFVTRARLYWLRKNSIKRRIWKAL